MSDTDTCKRGHAGEWYRRPNGKRECRQCKRDNRKSPEAKSKRNTQRRDRYAKDESYREAAKTSARTVEWVDRNCLWCGESVPRNRRVDSKTCSDKCYELRLNNETSIRASRTRRSSRGDRVGQCGHPIPVGYRSGTKFCSASCQRKDVYDRLYETWKPRILHTNAMRRARLAEVTRGDFTHSDVVQRMIDLGDACFYCDGRFEHVDHFMPIAKGGSHSLGNLVPSCEPCNLSKRDRLPGDWLSEVWEVVQ